MKDRAVYGRGSISFCLCADDFAITPGVSRGILEALAARRLNAASVLATSVFWPGGAPALRGYAAEADIGLHLNLTHGAPLGPMPAFAPAGQFPELGRVLKAALKRQLPETEIRQEIERQIETFQQHFGAPPAFVDGHHHVQILAQLRPLLFECLEEKGLAGKIWLRDSSDKLHRITARGLPNLKKALAVSWLAKGFAREAAAHGFAANDGFSGFSAFRAEEDYAGAFARYLRAPGPRHLIMCHPGYKDDADGSLDPIAMSREQELGFLLSPSFFALLAQRGARLARLSETFGLARSGNLHEAKGARSAMTGCSGGNNTI